MSTLTLEFPVACATCGGDLDVNLDRRGTVTVEPCVDCQDHAKELGYQKGYEEAEAEAAQGGGAS